MDFEGQNMSSFDDDASRCRIAQCCYWNISLLDFIRFKLKENTLLSFKYNPKYSGPKIAHLSNLRPSLDSKTTDSSRAVKI